MIGDWRGSHKGCPSNRPLLFLKPSPKPTLKMTAKPLAFGTITSLNDAPLRALEAVRAMGIPTIQLQYPAPLDTPDGIGEIRSACAQSGVEITVVFCGFAGESYADIPTVRATVGLVPPATRAARIEMTLQIARFAAQLGVSRVAAHIGFIPENPAELLYLELVETLRHICDELAKNDQMFLLETGQETARGLKQFLETVSRPNLRVNFDPANMVLYGQNPPLEALETLFPYIESVHCKDGLWPTAPDTLGVEVPFGEGDVGAVKWLERLLELGYRGPLTIEREIEGEARTRDILTAKTLIESVLNARAVGEAR